MIRCYRRHCSDFKSWLGLAQLESALYFWRVKYFHDTSRTDTISRMNQPLHDMQIMYHIEVYAPFTAMTLHYKDVNASTAYTRSISLDNLPLSGNASHLKTQ